MELHVSCVQALPVGIQVGHELKRIERGLVISGFSKVIAMQVNRMGEPEEFVCPDHRGYDLGRGHCKMRYLVMDTGQILSPAPCLGASGVGSFIPNSFTPLNLQPAISTSLWW